MAAQRALVGAEQVELHDHGVVGRADGHELVALVGERRAAEREVLAHLVLAVEHLTSGHQLVARVGEGAEHGVVVVAFSASMCAARRPRAGPAGRQRSCGPCSQPVGAAPADDDGDMIDHLAIQVADFDKAAAFYDAVLATIGGKRILEPARA